MSLSFLPRPTVRPGATTLTPLDPVPVTDDQRRVAHMAASLLLGYPDNETAAAAQEVRAAVGSLPEPVRDRLDRLATTLVEGEPEALRADYVATFDLKRKCSMYLSYYTAGDTRRRGMALVRFVEAYRAAGWETTGSELPDYLPTVLELSARSGPDGACIAGVLLASHREGIEVLRAALAATASPWTAGVEAVCLTLPAVDARTLSRITELVTGGPPAELVGLAGFGDDDQGGPAWT
ncbi:nitrate reductase molybdenum cofactor assembly chaperone [Antribacter gilvus]|uniref:nitrate reductase molybdenum cofactor assembly chaperone n=1 Tax=Antribacter gilvus TaxID=2304675 RepID=UPI000F76D35A|nr:nitrate reductase molybdenum cofactor assembly chaperone [Antribacter gilvus]